MRVLGGRFEKESYYLRIFNPYARTNRSRRLSTVYRSQELEKRRKYQQRVLEVEKSSFTPLVFSACGGMGQAANIFYNRLASLLAIKKKQSYSKTVCWLRTHLSFALLRSAFLCIRGSRIGRTKNPMQDVHPIDLILAESLSNHD